MALSAAFTIGFLFLAGRPAAANGKITIVNGNDPGVGFNDPTPVAPVGGNPMTTRGAQRLFAFQYAAELWAETLDSPVEIVVLATFEPLGANVLGSAGATAPFATSPVSGLPLDRSSRGRGTARHSPTSALERTSQTCRRISALGSAATSTSISESTRITEH